MYVALKNNLGGTFRTYNAISLPEFYLAVFLQFLFL